jgi:hypothetical protein
MSEYLEIDRVAATWEHVGIMWVARQVGTMAEFGCWITAYLIERYLCQRIHL